MKLQHRLDTRNSKLETDFLNPRTITLPTLTLNDKIESGRQTIDQALRRLLPADDAYPESIHRAMRHSVFAGGKRLRPILCIEAARMTSPGGQRLITTTCGCRG